MMTRMAQIFLRNGQRNWREGFWNLWGDLEISYALALDMGWKSLDDVRGQIVAQAVTGLKSLVGAKLLQE
jgi:hypothetical protein